LKELSASEIVVKAIRLYVSNVFHFVTPFLASGLVNGVLSRYFNQFIPFDLDSTDFVQWVMSNLATVAGLLTLVGIGEWIVNVVASGIVVKSASDLLEKESASLKESLHHVLGRLPSLLVTGFLTGLLTFFGLMLLVLPGIIFVIIFSLVVPVIVIEGRRSLESLERSRRLVSHRWSKTFAVQLLTLTISAIATWIVGSIDVTLEPLSILIQTIVSAIVQPINPTAITILYYSVTAKEGVSTTQTAQALISFCSQCGYKLNTEDAYCPNCGNKKWEPKAE